MNERIKAIWNRAASSYERSDTSWQTQQNFLNRFAELIIKETLQVARAGVEYGDGMEDAVYKYFGVANERKH